MYYVYVYTVLYAVNVSYICMPTYRSLYYNICIHLCRGVDTANTYSKKRLEKWLAISYYNIHNGLNYISANCFHEVSYSGYLIIMERSSISQVGTIFMLITILHLVVLRDQHEAVWIFLTSCSATRRIHKK